MLHRCRELIVVPCAALVIVLGLAAAAAPAGATGPDRDLVTEAVGAARQERWAEAERLAAQSGEPLAITLIAWMRLAYGRERAG
ncbi:MAG TPA: hypothetical protein VFG47_13490, partial [Geminicoccaceae bacterium]|nr:hypothetical protein [Geminicoccaceae bacterium]